MSHSIVLISTVNDVLSVMEEVLSPDASIDQQLKYARNLTINENLRSMVLGLYKAFQATGPL